MEKIADSNTDEDYSAIRELAASMARAEEKDFDSLSRIEQQRYERQASEVFLEERIADLERIFSYE